MEVKKSYQADLEHGRLTAFLLGLVAALTLLLVALQLTTGDSHANDDALLDDMVREMEVMPLRHEDEMTALAPQQVQPTVLSEQLNVVHESAEEKPAELETTVESNGPADLAGEPVDSEPAAALVPADAQGSERVVDFRVVEELPEFPGGMTEFMKWLTRNLKYPPLARQQKVEGKVLVSFIVEKDGTTSDLRLVKGVHAYVDREALRVMRMMPKWKPGKDQGKTCRTMVCIPVVFAL